MKVVFFSSSGKMVGGGVACLKQILLHAREHGVDPFVILPFEGDLESFLADNGIPYEIVRSYDWLRPAEKHGGLRNEASWIAKGALNRLADEKVKRILLREKPDVYHINCIYNPCGAKAAHSLGIPVVWHIREFAEINGDTPFFRNKRAAYRLIGRSERIVCVSESVREHFSRLLPEERMALVYDGIAPLRNDARLRRPRPDGSYTITMAGAARIKGHTDALVALGILRNRGYSRLVLKIAGRFADDDYFSHLGILIEELGLSGAVVFPGLVGDMDREWDCADIALVCSRFESFGLSAVEAMAHGVPLVCTNTTGVAETTENGALAITYPADKPEELADALERLIVSYDSYAADAYDHAAYIASKYPAEKACEGIFSVFDQVARREEAPHGSA